MIDKQTKRAYLEALEIEEYLLEKMKLENAFIADYEIDFRVSLFSSKKYNHFEQMNGSSFFEFRPYLFNFLKKDGDKDDHYGWTFDTNHNELGCNGYEDKEFHPLQHQFHCALMHDLYDHTYLAWQDIVDIEDVWIDVEVKMQNNIVM